MKTVRVCADTLMILSAAGAGRDFRIVSSARHATNYMFTFFLTWVREGRYHPYIRMPRTCKKVRSQTSPLGREQGRKEVSR